MASDPSAASPEPVQPAGVEAVPAGAPTKDDCTMAMFAHLGGIITGFIIPLIIWLIKKDQSKFVDDQGKEALNFQLTLLIGDVIGWATLMFCVGLIVLLAVYVVRIIFGIMAGIAANKGQTYRYPFAIRMIK